MKNIILLAVLLGLVSCGSDQTTFSKAEYISSEEEHIIDDKFNENDMHKIVETVTTTLTQCSKFSNKRQRVLLGDIQNFTSEHLDLDMILNKMKTTLIKNKSFNFVNDRERAKMATEMGYQNSGEVAQSTILKGNEKLGSQYLLSGDIHSNVQMVGDKKMVYYYFTVNLTNIESGLVECTEEKELKKQFKRVSL